MSRRRPRDGSRKKRKIQFRPLKLKHYLIVTDGEKTEKNYFEGLRNYLPEEARRKIRLKVIKAKNANKLIEKCHEVQAQNEQFSETWLVFDRDRVPQFDQIIRQASADGIETAWSNACIEVWFSAYFGNPLSVIESTTCCKKFGDIYKKNTSHEYKKSNPDIYKMLYENGDEELAIRRSENRRKSKTKDNRPSDRVGCTEVDRLVKAIRENTK